MRMYWQPAALVDELQGPRPIRPVKLLGENLVMFKDEQGRYGLIERLDEIGGALVLVGPFQLGHEARLLNGSKIALAVRNRHGIIRTFVQ
jgi:hypothetical protein